MTPNIAVVRIETPHWRSIPLWIPLFLLWIPVILLSPILLLVIVGLSIAGRVDPLRALSVIWGIVCSLPGTNVRVTSEGTKVVVRIL
ncbi:conserved hypothetical protein [Candidatus Sulfotelmatomonas gaucii]|uniref:Uncharacterized protein n=1 Tax=Candidatus Sulfuritelmatomonas gaucii TaxID=2043161 RepID=A0A2N9L7R3_9BACT|nr:conserved hypothetical protein [Candidatus Sulfotelmatomonas gaucii]